ncbi:hypothetical protein CY35_17G021100 [Sphagnum magellanicum]|nr:hypothetical protein CY35_17G021100 [Sphagnum magellanicum]
MGPLWPLSMWQLSCCQRLQCDGNLLSIVEVVCPQEVNFVAPVLLTTISKIQSAAMLLLCSLVITPPTTNTAAESTLLTFHKLGWRLQGC